MPHAQRLLATSYCSLTEDTLCPAYSPQTARSGDACRIEARTAFFASSLFSPCRRGVVLVLVLVERGHTSSTSTSSSTKSRSRPALNTEEVSDQLPGGPSSACALSARALADATGSLATHSHRSVDDTGPSEGDRHAGWIRQRPARVRRKWPAMVCASEGSSPPTCIGVPSSSPTAGHTHSVRAGPPLPSLCHRPLDPITLHPHTHTTTVQALPNPKAPPASLATLAKQAGLSEEMTTLALGGACARRRGGEATRHHMC